MTLRYWAMIAGLGMLWGASFALNAIILRELGPISVSLGRVGLGALFCWGFVLLTKRPLRFPKGQGVTLALLAITNFALPLAIYPIAQGHMASSVAGIMNGLTPVAVVVISQFWPGGEKAGPAKFTGIFFGFIGVCLLAVPAYASQDNSELWAMGVILIAPLSYGVSLNIMRAFREFDSTLLATYALTIATIVLFPLAIAMEGTPTITQPATIVSLLIIGFVSTGFAFIGLYWLVPRVGGTNMSTATYIAPISALLLGVLLLGETLEREHILGTLAILVGMLFVDGRILSPFRRRARE